MQCVGSHPKVLGISVIQECGGVSVALFVLLSRFKKIPRVRYYDNAWNLLRSVVLRCPWVNDQCTIVCTSFYYAEDTCYSVCDEGSSRICANHATSGAESINHLWKYSKSHLRFLRPDNLVPLIAARAIFYQCTSDYSRKAQKTRHEHEGFSTFRRTDMGTYLQ